MDAAFHFITVGLRPFENLPLPTDASSQNSFMTPQLLAMPAGEVMSVTRLKLDPGWDPLGNDPRFQALLKKYAPAQPDSAASGVSS